MARTIIKTVDRTAEVKALAATYPKFLRECAQSRTDHRVHQVSNGTTVMEYTQPARNTLALWSAAYASGAKQAEIKKETAFTSPTSGFEETIGFSNALRASEYASELEGTSSKLQQGLEAAITELAKSGLVKHLETMSGGTRKRRRRVYSDCEGDFDYTRKDEDLCMSRMVNNRKEFPQLEAIIPIAMNSGANSDEITKFAARSLALCEVLETCGFQVAITLEIWMKRTIGYAAAPCLKAILGAEANIGNTIDMCRFPLREAGDYGDVRSVATMASNEFFRRALFAIHYNQVHYAHGLKDALKSSPDRGKGVAENERPIDAGQGQIVLTMDTVNGLFSMDAATREAMFRHRLAHVVTRKDMDQAS